MESIVDLIDDIVASIPSIPAITTAYPKNVTGKPFYMAGHLGEIRNRLINKSRQIDEKYNKYPLVILRLDTPRTVISNMAYYNLNIIIVSQTSKEINAEERVPKVYKPILYPLYEAFMQAIVDSGEFTWDGDPSMPDHIQIDRPYWGTVTPDQNTDNVMPDPLDAIEIINLKINRIIC